MGGNRSRKPYRVVAEAAVLNLAQVPPWNSTLIQIVIGFSAPTTTLGNNFIIKRISTVNALHNYDILNEDLAITGVLTQLVIPCRYEFSIGDTITAQYANDQALDVGLELIFEEAQ